MACKYDYPVGYIVEGFGEYHSFNSMFCKITGKSFRTPCSKPKGYGRILKSLEVELTDLVIAHSVAVVVVCIDLKDVLSNPAHGFNDCAELRAHLQERADRWLLGASQDGRVRVAPQRVVVVIQVQKFESWFLADVEAFNASEYCAMPLNQIADVDNMRRDPVAFLREALKPSVSLKSPVFAKRVAGGVRPEVASDSSRSYRKFSKEARSAAALWEGLVE